MIRRATENDFAAIGTIQQLSPEASAWDPSQYSCYVFEEPGRVAGFIVTRQTAPGESEILNLAVDPEYRGRGIAKRLVQHALSAAPGQWFLEVRESNQAAIALYRSLGFQTCGRRPDYYDDPP